MQCGGREATLIHSLLVSTCPRVLHSACCTPTPGAGPSAGRDLEPEPHLFPFLRYSVLNRTQHSSDMWAVAQDRGCVVCVEARPLCGCAPWRLVFVLTKLGPAQPSPAPCHRVQAARLQGDSASDIYFICSHRSYYLLKALSIFWARSKLCK